MELKTFEWTGADKIDAPSMLAALETEGAFLLRNALSAEEIALAREQVRRKLVAEGRRLSLGKTQPNAAILAPEIDWVLSQPNIVNTFKAILDREAIFTGHCDIHMNMLSGWHKDSGEHIGGYFKGDYFGADDCRVYKAAVYLQDAGPRDGLTVRLGSHRSNSHEGVEVRIPSRCGDVVFFDVRLSHTGQLPDTVETGIKVFAKLFKQGDGQDPAWVTRTKELYWKVIGRRDRLSIFFTFGAANRFTQEFAFANMLRQNNQSGAAVVQVPKTLSDDLRKQGVETQSFA